MNRYTFSLGDSDEGAVGACLDIDAETEAEAVNKARAALEGCDLTPLTFDTPQDGVSEIRLYLNPKHLSESDIIDIEENVED
jgi:hypothetical protein